MATLLKHHLMIVTRGGIISQYIRRLYLNTRVKRMYIERYNTTINTHTQNTVLNSQILCNLIIKKSIQVIHSFSKFQVHKRCTYSNVRKDMPFKVLKGISAFG